MSNYKIMLNYFITKWDDAKIFPRDFKNTVEYKTNGDVQVGAYGYSVDPNSLSTRTHLDINERIDCDLILDRAGTINAFAGLVLRTAALQGTQVMNYPVAFDECKSLDYQIAHEIGIPVPRTVVILPGNIARFVLNDPENGWNNFRHEVDFREIIDSLGGFPVYMKPSHGGGKVDVEKCNNMTELMTCYIRTQGKQMMIQKGVDYDHFVRCFAIGDKSMIVRYAPDNPAGQRYIAEEGHLTREEGILLEGYIRKLNTHLGYVMNTQEFARDRHTKKWYAIDFTNGCNFDMRPCELSDKIYTQALHMVVDLAIDYVYNPRPIRTMDVNYLMANRRLIERVKNKPGINLYHLKRFFQERREITEYLESSV